MDDKRFKIIEHNLEIIKNQNQIIRNEHEIIRAEIKIIYLLQFLSSKYFFIFSIFIALISILLAVYSVSKIDILVILMILVVLIFLIYLVKEKIDRKKFKMNTIKGVIKDSMLRGLSKKELRKKLEERDYMFVK